MKPLILVEDYTRTYSDYFNPVFYLFTCCLISLLSKYKGRSSEITRQIKSRQKIPGPKKPKHYKLKFEVNELKRITHNSDYNKYIKIHETDMLTDIV